MNILINNKNDIDVLYNNILDLSEDFKSLNNTEEGKKFVKTAIEGLDAIIMTLEDVVKNKDQDDSEFLAGMTSEKGHGVESVRKAYLSQEKDLKSDDKKNLLSAMNRCERIVLSLGDIGKGFMQLT